MSNSVRIQPPLREFNFHSINLDGSVCTTVHWLYVNIIDVDVRQHTVTICINANCGRTHELNLFDGNGRGCGAWAGEKERVDARVLANQWAKSACHLWSFDVRCMYLLFGAIAPIGEPGDLWPRHTNTQTEFYTRAHARTHSLTSISSDDNINRVMYSAFKVSTSQFILASAVHRDMHASCSAHTLCGMAYCLCPCYGG